MAKRRFRSRGRFRRIRRRRFGNKRLKRIIKGTVRRMQEIKYSTLSTGYAATDGFTGGVTRLNPLIAAGTGKNQRIGNKIRFKFFQFRLVFFCSDGTSGANPLQAQVRIMIVQPRQQPSAGLVAGPTNTEIFDNSTSPIQMVTSSVKNNNLRVIMDKTFSCSVLQNTGAADTLHGNPINYHLKKKVRISNNCLFQQTIDTLPTDPKDNYYLVVIADSNALNDLNVNIAYTARISFIDL